MRGKLLRPIAAVLAGLGLAVAVLPAAAGPAAAARFSVSITVDDTSVVTGDTIRVSGSVSPRPSSRYVYLQKRAVGSTRWSTVRRARTTAGGHYSIRVRIGSDTDRYYRVYKPRTASRKAAHSRAVQVVVDAPGTWVVPALTGLAPASGALSGGTVVVLSGSGLAGTRTVTFTPLVARADTAAGDGVLPEVAGTVTAASDAEVSVVTPASLGGVNLVKVYAPSGTLTSTFTYVATPVAATTYERQVLDELNARRAEPQTCHEDGADHRMPAVAALTLDETLSDVALSHSRDLAARQDLYRGLAHETWGTSGFGVRFRLGGVNSGAFGEILALSPEGYSASDVVDQWMESRTGHCESLMSARWTRAGVGTAPGVWQQSGRAQDSIFSTVDLG